MDDAEKATASVKDKKYCVECGREKKTAIFMLEDYCSENCRKSIAGEGPKVGLSQECIDRNYAAGNFMTVEQFREQNGFKSASDDG